MKTISPAMKIKILLSICFLSSLVGISQSHNKGTLSFNLGYDVGLHGTVSEYSYNGILIDQDTSAAGTKMVRFDVQYNMLKFLSLGLNYRGGSYIEDPDNAEANGNKVNMTSIGLRLYPVNKDKFTMYFGLNFGGSNLEINRIYTFFVSTKHRYIWRSPHFSADMGFNWYFAKNIGLNFALGYSGQNFNLEEYYIEGTRQDLTNQEHTFLTKGIHVNLGLAFHVFGK